MSGLGRLVRERRQALGLTQSELALKTGLRQTYISQVEQGEIAIPRDYNLDALGAALGLTRPDFYRAAGMLESPEERPDLPAIEDVMELIRRDPEILAEIDRIKRTHTPETYERVIRVLAEAWRSNARMSIATFKAASEARGGDPTK